MTTSNSSSNEEIQNTNLESGQVNLSAGGDTTIGQDVVGRDKIVNNVNPDVRAKIADLSEKILKTEMAIVKKARELKDLKSRFIGFLPPSVVEKISGEELDLDIHINEQKTDFEQAVDFVRNELQKYWEAYYASSRPSRPPQSNWLKDIWVKLRPKPTNLSRYSTVEWEIERTVASKIMKLQETKNWHNDRVLELAILRQHLAVLQDELQIMRRSNV